MSTSPAPAAGRRGFPLACLIFLLPGSCAGRPLKATNSPPETIKQECPQPEEGLYSPNTRFPFEALLHEVLQLDQEQKYRVLVVSSDGPTLTGVRLRETQKGENRYEYVVIKPRVRLWENLWAYMFKHRPDTLRDAIRNADLPREVDVTVAPADPGVAGLLEELWNEVIKRTRYGRNNIAFDSKAYHFWAAGIGAAMTWSPDRNTPLGDYVEIGDLLTRVARQDVGRPALERDLEARARKLLEDVKASAWCR